jgi:hypothetical protein
MPITRATFGLVTQLLDLTPDQGEGTEEGGSSPWAEVLEPVRALGVGALAEEVALGDAETVERFLALQAAAHGMGIETFLRVQELSEEGLQALRERALDAAAKLSPGEMGPPELRVMADLGQPGEEELSRWLSRAAEEAIGGRGGDEEAEGPAGAWGQALAFSLFAPDGESAIPALDRVADRLVAVAARPGVEQPVWLAAFGVGAEGPAGDAEGVVQVGAHALAMGVERIFLAAGPEAGWWPADLRSPPPPLLAFRTLSAQLDGASHVVRIGAGQYMIERPDQPERYLLWRSDGNAGLPAGLTGTLVVTPLLGEAQLVDVARFRIRNEPVFVEETAW